MELYTIIHLDFYLIHILDYWILVGIASILTVWKDTV